MSGTKCSLYPKSKGIEYRIQNINITNYKINNIFLKKRSALEIRIYSPFV